MFSHQTLIATILSLRYDGTSIDLLFTFSYLDVHIRDSLILQDDWTNLEKPYGSIFLSIPTVLDSSLAPEGHHILHIFTTSSIEDWEVKSVHSPSVGSNLFHIYLPFFLFYGN